MPPGLAARLRELTTATKELYRDLQDVGWCPLFPPFEPTAESMANIASIEGSLSAFGGGRPPRSVVYVIDVSGSMFKSLPFVQQELQGALERLPRGTAFNLVAYSEKVTCWRRSAAPADDDALADASDWIAELKVQSSTSTVAALETVFEELDVQCRAVPCYGLP